MLTPFANSPPIEIVLDLSRLLSRILHSTPTGVDRCEMAYARGLLDVVPDRLRFGAVHPSGIYGRLPRRRVLRFLDMTEDRWESKGFASLWDRQRSAVATLTALWPRRLQRPSLGPRVFLQASPNNLTRPKLMRRILQAEQARFVCLVHDLIPLQFPEYARPNGLANHRARVETLSAYADGIVTNSAATMEALLPWIENTARRPRTAVAHLGTRVAPVLDGLTPHEQRPYFVAIGTIEPRKNHLLLLNLWRQMSSLAGPLSIPKLVVIGRRGWENEQVVDMLERCAALRGCVEELNHLSDGHVTHLLAGARALLMPSFAEGYGMPVSEALALGVPVICSDLPSLREAGGGVPEYLNPLDGAAWAQAIEAYTDPDSDRRLVQLQRLAGWRAPIWKDHIDVVLDIVQSAVA